MERKNHNAMMDHFTSKMNRLMGGHRNKRQTWDDFGTHILCSCGEEFHIPFEEISPSQEA